MNACSLDTVRESNGIALALAAMLLSFSKKNPKCGLTKNALGVVRQH